MSGFAKIFVQKLEALLLYALVQNVGIVGGF